MRICVAGVGGAGLNVLDRISLDRMMDATLVSMHTDVRVLGHAMTPVKIQLGTDHMRGIGSGGDPENGYEAAQESREQIKNALQGHDMVFVCCGLGGGTGCGAAPVVAEVAKEVGAMVFVFATMPFSFEGRRRITQAEVALEDLGSVADALILFENNRMGELTLPKEGIQKAFSQADQLIGHSVRAISTMVMQPGIVRMGIADLLTALRGPNSRCLFGFGEARGSNRVTDALKRALKSPLINQGLLLQNARNLLVHVAGGESLTLAEVESLMKQLGKHVPEDTQIMFGLAVEPKLGDMISITLVSSLSVQEISVDSALARAVRPGRGAAGRPALPKGEAPPSAPAPETPAYRQNGVHAGEAPVHAAPPAAVAPPPAAEQAPPVSLAEAPAPVEPEETQAPDLFALDTAPKAPPVSALQVSLRTSIFSEGLTEELAPETFEPEGMPASEAAPAPATEFKEEVLEEEEVFVMPTRPKAPVAETPAGGGKASIFSVIDDEEEEDEDEEIDGDEEDDEISGEEQYSVQDREAEEPKNPWAGADSYDEDEPSAPPAAPEPSRRPEARPVPVAAGSTKLPNDFKQGTFDLNPEEVGRFKGTDKTIVEGEDLDIPTWMRMRQKLKR